MDIPIDYNHKLTVNGERTDKTASEFLSEFESRRLENQLHVPTTDDEVRAKLRQLGEPITLFGEERPDRRERLINLLDGQDLPLDGEVSQLEEEEEEEEFYTPGGPDLLKARQSIASFSLCRARDRISSQNAFVQTPFVDTLVKRRKIQSELTKFTSLGSQAVGSRATSIVRVSNDDKLIAAGSWDGTTYILDRQDLSVVKKLRGHEEKIGGVDWNPQDSLVTLATSGAEGLVNLYDLGSEMPVSTLRGHDGRVCRVEFHPSGDFLASASFDLTWRMWDIHKEKELLLQEGHSKEVFALSHHPDGSLLASGGLDAIGHVWDLRTGKSIFTLNGHIKGINAMDWSSNGVDLVTGSADCSIRVWDIRMAREKCFVPAHTKMVSDVRFFKGRENSGTFLASSSYDNQVNIYSADNWLKVKTLQGHHDKVMSCDVSSDGEFIVSSGWDKSVRLWVRE